VANSLQIIASILQLKARSVSSDETRQHLQEAHQRVMSVAAVQSHLHATEGVDQIAVGAYLTKLCSSLAGSMIGEDQPIELTVIADEGQVGSAQAVSLGLVVTELVINAVKYAFPAAKPGAMVQVTYECRGDEWKLSVADNGVGKQSPDAARGGGGLGTAIVRALAKQLGADVAEVKRDPGMTVSLTRRGFEQRTSRSA